MTNPIADTPDVNAPASDIQPIRPRLPNSPDPPAAEAEALPSMEEVTVSAEKNTVTGLENARVVVYEGNVDARIGTYRLQADKVTIYEATNTMIAEGSVVFDQADQQRITGSRAEWNYATKNGYFVNSTGFTNQTQDNTVIYFTADRVERVGVNTIIAINAEVTACEDNVPKWSFRTSRAKIVTGERVGLRRPRFLVKGVPLLYLPYASVPIKRRDRASGFLTPTFSGSGEKGFRFSNAYYQTLGRSADITLRSDIYTARGIGFGADLRTRANARSSLNVGFYGVKDRVFGPNASEQPDQGGTSFYADGVQYFSNGFVAAADVNITSNLAFRQIFSDSIQQAISPEERSQVFLNRNFRDYSFNVLARADVTSLPNTRVRVRQLPSITLDKRPSIINGSGRFPLYFSFESGLDGVSRKDTPEDPSAAISDGTGAPIVTPSVVQRLNVRPRFSVPLTFGNWTATATGSVRATYYSNSVDPTTRLVLGRDVVRGYAEFEVDVRPPALARNFRSANNSFRFRHVIEPYVMYRKIEGVTNSERIILFDSADAVADTNEIEFGVTNRFFTRRSTESVSSLINTNANERPATDTATDTVTDTAATTTTSSSSAASAQPYELLSLRVRGKYFFDPYFGGALIPGQRNQFYPINTFSGFAYGGAARRFSPLNIEMRLRPRSALFADTRLNLDVRGEGVRDLAVSFGVIRPLVQAFQTFYYTRAIGLAPSLRSQFGDQLGREPGTLQGSQWSPTLFLGKTNKGVFGGMSFFFDFQNRPGRGNSSLISSTATLGYSFDCCAVTIQNYTFNVGVRNENRFVFSFRLNGIGTFGTEQIGQRFP